MSICNSRADGIPIASKCLLVFSSGLTEFYRRQNVSSAKYFQLSICSGWTFNEYPAIANTFSLCAIRLIFEEHLIVKPNFQDRRQRKVP